MTNHFLKHVLKQFTVIQVLNLFPTLQAATNLSQ